MNIEELHEYLNTFSKSEKENIKNIIQYYHFQTDKEVFQNFSTIKKNQELNPIIIISDYLDKEADFKIHSRFNNISQHQHKYIEMSYVYSGEINMIINNNHITLHKGDLTIVDTNVVHQIMMAGKEDILINFMLSPDFFNENFFHNNYHDNIISNFIIHSLYEAKKYNDYLYFKTQSNELIHLLLSQLLIEFICKDLYSTENIKHYLLIIFNELIRIYDIQDKTKEEIARSKKTYRFLEFKSYIESNFLDTDLLTAADYFGFHPNYFSKYVKELTGQNFKTLVLKEKLKKASFLLLQSKQTIAEISYECGFTNLNTFYKMFKSEYNLTPKQYRKIKSLSGNQIYQENI